MDTLTLLRTGYYGTKTLINTFINNDINQQILDPLTCILRLSLLTFKEKGTKISICNNRIYYQAPNILQGPMRWTYGDARGDLHNLCNPIEKAIEWYKPSDNKNIGNIFKYAIKGLTRLKQSYIMKNNNVGDSNLVCHSISHYITLLQNSLNGIENKDKKGQELENTSLKKLWSEKEIEIINNLLDLAHEQKKSHCEFTYVINSIETILKDKDEKVTNFVNKISTTL